MKLQNAFRRARQRRGLSQVELATLVGVSQPTISQLERGVTLDPSWGLLSAIAFRLDVTPQQLMPPRRRLTPRRLQRKSEAA